MAKTEVKGKVYYEDSRGALIPEENLKPLDVLRNETVEDIITTAKTLRDQMVTFKKLITEKIDCFVDLSAEEHNIHLGGAKGNIKLRSIDGRYLVQVAQNETMDFNEKLQVAEALID